MDNTTFAKETVLGVADEIEPLLKLHYEEVALNKDVARLDPDWARYVALEERGDLHVFTIRDNGVLIGYAVFFMVWHIHYKLLRVAQNDIVFILPERRHGLLASKFTDYCEEALKKLGAQKITYHIKVALNWSPLLIRKGYEHEEIMVGKII